MRIRNTGSYPITLQAILGEDERITQLWNGNNIEMSSLGALQKIPPGGEVLIGGCGYPGAPGPPDCYGYVVTAYGACTSYANQLCAAKSVCTAQADPNLGFLEIDKFGFEYTAYVENQPITKREVGPVPLIIKCTAGK